MESFYVPPEYISAHELNIQGEEYHHLSRVLRKREGDRILAVDGNGTAYECTIENMNETGSRCAIQRVHPHLNEPDVNVTLMLPVLKNHTRVEWIVEKGTELGVRDFIPVHTERTIPHRIRFDRLEKISLAAMKQCKRSFLPRISRAINLKDMLASFGEAYDKVIIGHENAPVSGSMRRVYRDYSRQRVLLLAGPEGGFTEEEVGECERHGAEVVSLGIRRYRAETAALIMAVYIIHD